MSLKRRLERLEARRPEEHVDVEALRTLSDEDLSRLEPDVEEEVARGVRSFWDLYAVVSIQHERSMREYLDAYADARSATMGDEPPVYEEPREEFLRELEERQSDRGDPRGGRDAYRIWRYYDGERMPEPLRHALYGSPGVIDM